MARHRRQVKARTRGPGHANPLHRRDVHADSVPIGAGFFDIPLYVVTDPTDDRDADNQTDADSQTENAG